MRNERYKTVNSAGVLALRGGGENTEILMIRSGDGWAFPKGHIEDGETAEKAALRELREETGLIGRLTPDFCFETTSGLAEENRKIFYFLGTVIGGTLTPQLEETSECAWQPLTRCAELLRFPQDVPAVQAVCRAINFCHAPL